MKKKMYVIIQWNGWDNVATIVIGKNTLKDMLTEGGFRKGYKIFELKKRVYRKEVGKK